MLENELYVEPLQILVARRLVTRRRDYVFYAREALDQKPPVIEHRHRTQDVMYPEPVVLCDRAIVRPVVLPDLDDDLERPAPVPRRVAANRPTSVLAVVEEAEEEPQQLAAHRDRETPRTKVKSTRQ